MAVHGDGAIEPAAPNHSPRSAGAESLFASSGFGRPEKPVQLAMVGSTAGILGDSAKGGDVQRVALPVRGRELTTEQAAVRDQIVVSAFGKDSQYQFHRPDVQATVNETSKQIADINDPQKRQQAIEQVKTDYTGAYSGMKNVLQQIDRMAASDPALKQQLHGQKLVDTFVKGASQDFLRESALKMALENPKGDFLPGSKPIETFKKDMLEWIRNKE